MLSPQSRDDLEECMQMDATEGLTDTCMQGYCLISSPFALRKSHLVQEQEASPGVTVLVAHGADHDLAASQAVAGVEVREAWALSNMQEDS